ncbi:MAG: DUF362 domain-containing protein [Pirellulaceae bacterium]|nr:DUF362 domain-containing protein [Pirellulaceae bacterium]
MESVIIRRHEDYDDVAGMERILAEGMEQLGARPHGNVLAKPNIVFAHKRYGRYAYTQPNFMEALIGALRSTGTPTSVTIGERTALTVPTRYAYHQAGYYPMARRAGAKITCFDEEPRERVSLEKGSVHRSMLLSRSIVNADYRVWAPKLKNHVSSKITCALKLNIGICDSDERLVHHDYLLEEKIADLWEVGCPDLVAVDAILGGQRNELVPTPLPIGAIIMGTNGVAVDAIGARILGLQPDDVKHLMIAHERGHGPVSLSEIEIQGDISLDELIEKVGPVDRSYNDLRTMPLNVEFFLGPHPQASCEDGDAGLCHTGCINMLKAVFAILDAYDPGSLEKMRPFAVVVGRYPGDVEFDGTVILVGDCTEVEGEIKAKKIKRVKGCPVPVPFFTFHATRHGKVKSPYLDPRAFHTFPYFSALQMASKILHRLF